MHRKFGVKATALPRTDGVKRRKGYYGVSTLAQYDMAAQRTDGCSDE